MPKKPATPMLGGAAASLSTPSKENAFLPFPQDLYKDIPPVLAEITDKIPLSHEKDLFLTGVLPVAASLMPNTIVKYGGYWQALNLYMAVLASASAGKSRLRTSRQVGERLNDILFEESRAAFQDYRRQRGEAQTEASSGGGFDVVDRPPFRRLFIAGDTSAAKIKESLYDSPHACIHETEAKSLAQALDSEWGGFRHILLQSFHNEPIQVDRKHMMPILIRRPALSLCISGTPGSFEGVLTDTEDGLFSRFAFYYFETPMVFMSQFETSREEELDVLVRDLSFQVVHLYRELIGRDVPLYVRMPTDGQHMIDDAGRRAMQWLSRSGADSNLQANIKRSALVAFRIAAIFSVLDAWAAMLAAGESLHHRESLPVDVRYVKPALVLAFCYLEHALRLSEALQEGIENFTTRRSKAYSVLPSGEFERGGAQAVAKRLGISHRTLDRYLKDFVREGRLEETGFGRYRKPENLETSVSFREFI